MAFSKLEYRINDEENGFPPLYHYKQIDRNEVFCRRLCDYFIKDGKVYRQTSSLKEDGLFVIFVEEDHEEEIFLHAKTYEHIAIEIRLFQENEPSSLLFVFEVNRHEEALEYLGSDFVKFGEYEYKVISTEIDEDRSAYVLYVGLTGYQYETNQ